MFLKSVFNHSKLLFLLMIIFIAGQLFINYKRGVVFSPLFHYGMYSEVMHVKPTYQVWEVQVNGQKLSAEDFSIQQWDKIILPLQYYQGINSSNQLYHRDVKRLLQKLHLFTTEENFLSNCSYPDFEQWYKRYLQSVTGEAVSDMEITYRSYRFDSVLIPTDTATSLQQLCN